MYFIYYEIKKNFEKNKNKINLTYYGCFALLWLILEGVRLVMIYHNQAEAWVNLKDKNYFALFWFFLKKISN